MACMVHDKRTELARHRLSRSSAGGRVELQSPVDVGWLRGLPWQRTLSLDLQSSPAFLDRALMCCRRPECMHHLIPACLPSALLLIPLSIHPSHQSTLHALHPCTSSLAPCSLAKSPNTLIDTRSIPCASLGSFQRLKMCVLI